MADAVVAIEATNLFGLHASFTTTASSTTAPLTNVQVLDELGNVACQQNIADITNYSQSWSYCGSETGFVADFGTFLTTFGDFQTIGVVTGITINMTAAGYVTGEITGHQHADNAHASAVTTGRADVSDFLPHAATEAFLLWDGFGIPRNAAGTEAYIVTTGANSAPQSVTVTFSMNHVDQIDETGAHLVGKNLTPRCEISMDFIGVPTSNTAALLEGDFGAAVGDMLVPLVDSTDTNDSNTDFDTFAFTAHANADLETA